VSGVWTSTRVELQSIEPPRDIQQAMELQMRAERERRAAVTNAEAGKRAAILEAEGLKESQVRKRKARKDASVLRAQGLLRRALRWRKQKRSPSGGFRSRCRKGKLRCTSWASVSGGAAETRRGKGSTIFLPTEASGVMGAVGALRELLVRGAGSGTVRPPLLRPANQHSTRPVNANREPEEARYGGVIAADHREGQSASRRRTRARTAGNTPTSASP